MEVEEVSDVRMRLLAPQAQPLAIFNHNRHFITITITTITVSQITARLRDKLGRAKSANEMFRVFSKFNALFFRPRIKGAIQEFQSELIQRVKDDIKALQAKFMVQYARSEAKRISTVRDYGREGMRSEG